MQEIIFIFVVILSFWLWRDSLNAREQALVAAKRACKQLNVQFLDDTVSISRLRLCRTKYGTVALCRLYSFDFSLDGEVRRLGNISMRGQIIEDVMLDIDQETPLH